jgi:hypothetical protein
MIPPNCTTRDSAVDTLTWCRLQRILIGAFPRFLKSSRLTGQATVAYCRVRPDPVTARVCLSFGEANPPAYCCSLGGTNYQATPDWYKWSPVSGTHCTYVLKSPWRIEPRRLQFQQLWVSFRIFLRSAPGLSCWRVTISIASTILTDVTGS